MDPKNNKPQGEPQEITYQVMPKADGHYVSEPESTPAPKAPSVPQPPAIKTQSPVPPTGTTTLDVPRQGKPLWRNHWLYIILGLIVLAVLGYIIYSKSNTSSEPEEQAENQTPTTRLPKVWLKQYFNKEACDDQTVCADAVDPDSDGLANYDEFKAGSSPINSDTDSDGLADGDEVHVYKTEPTLKFTDRRDIVSANNWTDGLQIKSGYDPLTPALKFTESRLKQIEADIKTNPLNEPTITTLGINVPAEGTDSSSSETPATNVAIVIEGNKFAPDEVKVKVGDTVVWLNKDAVAHTVASDPHPSHTALPEFVSQSIASNQTYSFKFTKTGTWGYHDHLNPTIKGKVIVE